MSEIDTLRAQVKILREAHLELNGALRSAMQVALRDGKGTNWPGFRENIRFSLEASHEVLNYLKTADERP